MSPITISVECSAGTDLRMVAMPAMLDLAQRTGCRIELKANDTVFWVRPEDSYTALIHAFDRLYPKSRYVSTGISRSVPRPPKEPKLDSEPAETVDAFKERVLTFLRKQSSGNLFNALEQAAIAIETGQF